jgi:hypothetical protein
MPALVAGIGVLAVVIKTTRMRGRVPVITLDVIPGHAR